MSGEEGLVFSIFAIGTALLFIITLISVALYILSSLGLYKLAQNKRLEYPWLAWIPIANFYILGKLVNNLKVFGYDVPFIEVLLPVGCLASYLLNNVPVLGFIVFLIYAVLTFIVLYKLYRIYRPDAAVLWTVLGIVLPFLIPVFIFIIRNNNPVQA